MIRSTGLNSLAFKGYTLNKSKSNLTSLYLEGDSHEPNKCKIIPKIAVSSIEERSSNNSIFLNIKENSQPILIEGTSTDGLANTIWG